MPADPVPACRVSQHLRPDPVLLSQVGDALDGCARPAFVIGAAVDRDGAWNEAVQLAERHGTRVYVAPMSGRCGFPEDHRLFAGFLPALRERIVERLAGHDFTFAVGAPAFTYHIEGHGPHVHAGATLAQLIDGPHIVRPGRRWPPRWWAASAWACWTCWRALPRLPHIKAGKLRLLAVGSLHRSPLFPDVPTLHELGLKASTPTRCSAFYAPAGTPVAVVTRLNTEINRALASTAGKDRIAGLGGLPAPMISAEFGAKAEEDSRRFGAIIRERKIVGD